MADGESSSFAISGAAGPYDPPNGLYFSVATNAKVNHAPAGLLIDKGGGNWWPSLAFGTGTMLSDPENGEPDGGKIYHDGYSLVISGTSEIKLSSSVVADQIQSGSLAGAGSYLGLDHQNMFVLTSSGGGGGGGSPGGFDSTIQFNSGSSFSGSSNLTFIYDEQLLIVSASAIITGSGANPDDSAFRVEAGSQFRDNEGNPILWCQASGTTGLVGISTSEPKVELEVSWRNVTQLSDDVGGGEVVTFGTSSGNLTRGALYYLNSDGGWMSASAVATGSGNDSLLAIALSGGQPQSGSGMLIKGWFHADSSYQDSFVKGGAVYVCSASSGEGKFSSSAPDAADSYVRIVGYATDTPNVIYFNPSSDWVELS